MTGADAGGGLQPWQGGDERQQVHLTGFMGSGKTTVGQRLARRLVWSFVDLDVLIERYAGCSIEAIFEQQGEPAFREMESFVLRQAAQKPQTVVALGGGTLLRAENLALSQRTARLVWLRCSPAVLRERLGPRRPQRPLWSPEDLEAQLATREVAYRQAELVVDADGEADAVAAAIVAALAATPGLQAPQ